MVMWKLLVWLQDLNVTKDTCSNVRVLDIDEEEKIIKLNQILIRIKMWTTNLDTNHNYMTDFRKNRYISNYSKHQASHTY